jgi:hypothetical protein
MSRDPVFSFLKLQVLTVALGAVFSMSGQWDVAQAGQRQPCSPAVAVEQGKTYSYFQAMKASEDGHIVLHYGAWVWGLGPVVDVLQEDGYPVAAMVGGPKGAVRVFMNGQSSRQKFDDQDDIGNGFLGGMISEVYDKLVSVHKLEKLVCSSQVAGR